MKLASSELLEAVKLLVFVCALRGVRCLVGLADSCMPAGSALLDHDLLARAPAGVNKPYTLKIFGSV